VALIVFASLRAPGAAGLALALAASAVLPWHLPQEEGGLAAALWGLGAADADGASALAQALVHGRFWFVPFLLCLVAAALALLRPGRAPRRSGTVLALLGSAALVAWLAQALAIGVRGWTSPLLAAAFGPLEDRQFGIGLGGALSLLGALWLLADGLALRGLCRGDRFVAASVTGLAAAILVFTLWPVATILGRAFVPPVDLTLGAAFAERFLAAKIWGLGCLSGGVHCGVAWNTLALAIATAGCTTLLGLAFALVVLRSAFPLRRSLRLLTVLPIITPPFVIGLGLILIFGRAGLVNQWVEALFGVQLGRWIYGFDGVLLAQVFSFTPTAFLVLIGVVEALPPTLEEAAQTLRASRLRTFFTITLPLMRPGLANAFLVVFIESIADFGNPALLGGSFGVLSTEIFFAVVGAQSDFGRAAMLACILLVFALAAFFLQRRLVGRASYVALTGKGDAGVPQPLPRPVAVAAFAVAMPWAALTILLYVLVLAGGFVTTWGRDWTPTLAHVHRAFAIEVTAGGLLWTGGAWNSFFTTVLLAGIAAPLTAALGLLAAWILARQRFAGRDALEFALMLTFCVPGTVIGVAYVLTYNVPPLELTGTALILVACFVFRNMPVGVRAGLAAFSQIDRSLEEASATLRAATPRTLARVVLPLLKPAIVTALVYSFVRAMTTVSAVIFLVSARHEMATVYIINRAINGDYGLAIAYSIGLIALMIAAIALIHALVGQRRLGRRRPDFATAGARRRA